LGFRHRFPAFCQLEPLAYALAVWAVLIKSRTLYNGVYYNVHNTPTGTVAYQSVRTLFLHIPFDTFHLTTSYNEFTYYVRKRGGSNKDKATHHGLLLVQDWPKQAYALQDRHQGGSRRTPRIRHLGTPQSAQKKYTHPVEILGTRYPTRDRATFIDLPSRKAARKPRFLERVMSLRGVLIACLAALRYILSDLGGFVLRVVFEAS
jgi:hypothetical protein